MNRLTGLCAMVSVAASGVAALAESPGSSTLALAEPAPIALDLAGAYRDDGAGLHKGTQGAPAGDDAGAGAGAVAVAGRAAGPKWCQDDGGWWITVGAGAATDLDTDEDYNLHIAASTFLARDFELAFELGAWYFDQEGPNTGGINGSFIFRWHFWHDKEYSYTVYGDAGIGLLGAFDDTPADGTSFNFTPRLGVGATFKIDEVGDRFQVGLRYHHISNARIEGDSNNPSRDSIMVYAGLIFPF